MLTLVIIAILAYSFYTGYRRGLVMQAIRFVGYAISLMIAGQFAPQLAKLAEFFVPFPSIQQQTQLSVYNEVASFILDSAFYRAISFVAIAFVGWVITNLVSVAFRKVRFYEVFRLANHMGGGILNALISFVIVFYLLFILSLIPIDRVQQQFVDNPIAYRIVTGTPVLSDMASKSWLDGNVYR